MEYAILTMLGLVLLILGLLICIVLLKYLFANTEHNNKQHVYMLYVDNYGKMKLKKKRGTINNVNVKQWGNDE